MKTIALILALAFAGPLFTAFAPAHEVSLSAPTEEKCLTITNNTSYDEKVRVGDDGDDILIAAGATSAQICIPVGGKLYRVVQGQAVTPKTIRSTTREVCNFSQLFPS